MLMDKIPCIRCGVQILPGTAAKNDGLCMPCAAGIRESMETSREYYRKRRESEQDDPVRALWLSLVRRVGQGDGYSGLTLPERRYFAVGLLDGEVNNGGFDQYFYNSSSDYYLDAVAGLEELGATKSLELLLRAKQIVFGFRDVPTYTAQRRQTTTSDSQLSRLDPLDRQFWADPDGLVERVEAFLHEHGLIPAVA